MIEIMYGLMPNGDEMDFIIEGMRNPMNSWDKGDTINRGNEFNIGENDKKLMIRLAKAGTEHRKFMRMMPVYLRITAPLYWWKEFDTYKVGTVANSCSTMHKIAEKEFTLDDFSTEHLFDCESVSEDEFYTFDCGRKYTPIDCLNDTIKILNKWRYIYLNKGRTKSSWWQMIQLLPSSYNQTRNVMLNYEVLATIYRQRKNHKLDEWRHFCKMIESLPYFELIDAIVNANDTDEAETKEPEACVKWLPISDFYKKWAAGTYTDRTPVIIRRKTSNLNDDIPLHPITAVFKGYQTGWVDWTCSRYEIDEMSVTGYLDPAKFI